MIEVDVLLATYNGEKYLEELMNSLLSQKNVRIHLIVSDDGSNDGTLGILKKYSQEFMSYKLYVGPGLGPHANFVYLLSKTQAKFVAFADQDDIWLPNKLSRAVEILTTERKSLYFSDVIIEPLTKKRQVSKVKKIPNTFFRNSAKGCTMVMTSEFANIILKLNSCHIIMHDWAALIAGQLLQVEYFDPNPLIKYRIHNQNVVGIPTLRQKTIRFLINSFRKENNIKIIMQGQEVLRLLHNEKSLEVKKYSDFLVVTQSNLFKRFLGIWQWNVHNKRYKIQFFEILKILMGFYRCKKI